MDQNSNVDLTKQFDAELGARSAEAEKIDKFYEAHPEHKPTDGASEFKKPTNKNAGDLYKTCKKINEHNSLKEHTATKKTKKLTLADARKKVEVAIVGSAIVTVGVLGVIITKKAVDAAERELEFRRAEDYMNEYVMKDVLQSSGFEITVNEDETYVYNFSSADIANAKQYLIQNYGFDNGTSELAIDLFFDYSDEIFVIRGYDDAYDFFLQDYGNTYEINNAIYPPEHVFENMNQSSYVNLVNTIKNEREGVQGARS